MTLEQLLRLKTDWLGKAMTPHFRLSTKGAREGGIHFIIRAQDRNSETLNFIVRGNKLEQIP